MLFPTVSSLPFSSPLHLHAVVLPFSRAFPFYSHSLFLAATPFSLNQIQARGLENIVRWRHLY